MNATINQYYDGPGCDFKFEFRTRRPDFSNMAVNRPSHSRKRGRGPQLVNGIHRRRRKKIAW